MWWKKKKPDPERVQTSCGEFLKDGGKWYGEVEAGGHVVKIAIWDFAGQPNPVFLLRLPALLQRLPSLEDEARAYLEGLLKDEYALDEVCDCLEAEAFSLEFVYQGEEASPYFVCAESEEAIGDFVSVRFKAGEIVEYSTEFMH